MTDHSGLVTGLDEAPPPAPPFEDDGIHVVPGVPNALAVRWLGGMCDSSVEISVRQAQTLTVTLVTSERPGGCRLAGIGRGVVIRLTRPVDPAAVTLVVEP